MRTNLVMPREGRREQGDRVRPGHRRVTASPADPSGSGLELAALVRRAHRAMLWWHGSRGGGGAWVDGRAGESRGREAAAHPEEHDGGEGRGEGREEALAAAPDLGIRWRLTLRGNEQRGNQERGSAFGSR